MDRLVSSFFSNQQTKQKKKRQLKAIIAFHMFLPPVYSRLLFFCNGKPLINFFVPFLCIIPGRTLLIAGLPTVWSTTDWRWIRDRWWATPIWCSSSADASKCPPISCRPRSLTYLDVDQSSVSASFPVVWPASAPRTFLKVNWVFVKELMTRSFITSPGVSSVYTHHLKDGTSWCVTQRLFFFFFFLFCVLTNEGSFAWTTATTSVVMLGKSLISISFAIIYNYTAELFPTVQLISLSSSYRTGKETYHNSKCFPKQVVRSSAVGIGSTSARVSGTLTPLIFLLVNAAILKLYFFSYYIVCPCNVFFFFKSFWRIHWTRNYHPSCLV